MQTNRGPMQPMSAATRPAPHGVVGASVSPSAKDSGTSISRQGFRISTHKLPILKAQPIDEMNEKLGITVPEMIFGDNLVRIEHEKSKWSIEFNTFDALNKVDKTGNSMLKVAHSKEWHSTRQEETQKITEVVKPFDWSYTTDYKGTTSSSGPQLETSDKAIPLDLLRRPDPILLFDEIVLYEDEMADNGITMYSCKIRVMPDRLLLLCRFFMRLDNVLFRIRDTRVFVEFGTGEIIREYVAREEEYEKVRLKLASGRDDVLALMRDPNRLAEAIPTKDYILERVIVN